MCNCRGAWVRVDELCPPTSDINLTTHVISFEVRVQGVSCLVYAQFVFKVEHCCASLSLPHGV